MRSLLLAAAAMVVAAPAWAAGDCPAIPRRNPMPSEAVGAPVDVQLWRDQVAALDAKVPSLGLATKQLVFIGDSITAGWDPGIFSQFYGTRSPVLLGVIGDVTQGVLERLPREWSAMRPKVVVLLIGTNNTQWTNSTPENLSLGVAEIVRFIHTKSPSTKVLIVGILPRGAGPWEPLRTVNTKTNELIAKCADNQTTFYIDVGRNLVNASGQLSNEVSFDLLHLTPVGYALYASALEPEIKKLMGD
ncbi:GDSL-type esterase/lipase family protein [Acidisphaera sp. L21]|uniref:GDSL-type esterase/lipase family protein n=1 Tax=Acidisphaera sp. L21 TaxID=1641851 RepID=UPI00131EA128|nr:GDSL-type esterase/lipase family protein [Acidisphaera sp. L21]